MGIVRNVGHDARHGKVLLVIFPNRFLKNIRGTKILQRHLFGNDNTLRVLERSLCVAFDQWEGKEPEEVRVCLHNALLFEFYITYLDQIAIQAGDSERVVYFGNFIFDGKC